MAEKRWLQLTVLLSTLIVLGAICVLNPFWGLMDDHYNALEMVPAIEKQGLFSYAWQYGLNDLRWGMFRPTNPLMVYFLYWPAVHSAPWVLFILNALATFGILFLCAILFSRITEINLWPILVLFGCFSYLHDLLQHPSLQEKMIHLFGTLLLLFVVRRKRGVATWSGIAAFAFLGLLVKASFIVYLSMAVWLAFWRVDQDGWSVRIGRAFVLGVLLVGATLVFAHISSHGGYTSGHFSSGKILPNLLTFHGLIFTGTLLLFCGYAVWSGQARRNPRLLTCAVGMAAFLAIFLPWGITGYILTVSGPFFCVMIAYLGEQLLPARARPVWLALIMAACIGVTTYRSITMFGRLGDIGEMVSLGKSWEVQGVKEILMPCHEGRGAMERFFALIGHANVKFSVFEMPASPRDLDGKYVLFDNSMCPLPGRASMIEGCAGDYLYHGSFGKSYRVLKLSCK